MLVSEFQTNLSEIMEDTGFVQYTEADILRWLQDGIREIAAVRPDAYTETKNLRLLPTADTTGPFLIDTGDLRLINIVRNMGADGSTIGKAVRGPVKQEEMDLVDPDWHTEASVGWVKEYIWDRVSPKEFYVYPQVSTAGVYIEITVATMPTLPTVPTDTIPGNETYIPVLYEWAQYRLFSRDNEDTGAYAKAATHRDTFFALLGVKAQADSIISPSKAEHSDAKEA